MAIKASAQFSVQRGTVPYSVHKTMLKADDCSAFKPVPREVILEIFQYLTPRELCSLASVSQRFSTLSSDNMLWVAHLEHHFKSRAIPGTIPVKQQYQGYHSNIRQGQCVEECAEYADVLVRGDFLFVLENNQKIEIKKVDEARTFKLYQTLELPSDETPYSLEAHENYLCVATEEGSLFIYRKNEQGVFVFLQHITKMHSGSSQKLKDPQFGDDLLIARDDKNNVTIWKRDGFDQFRELETPDDFKEWDTFQVQGNLVLATTNGCLKIWKRDQGDGFFILDPSLNLNDVECYTFSENLLYVSFTCGFFEIWKKDKADRFQILPTPMLKSNNVPRASAITVCGDFVFITIKDEPLSFTVIWEENKKGEFVQLQTLQDISFASNYEFSRSEFGHGRLFLIDSQARMTHIFNFGATSKEALKDIAAKAKLAADMQPDDSSHEAILREIALRLLRIPQTEAEPIQAKLQVRLLERFKSFIAQPKFSKMPELTFNDYIASIGEYLASQVQNQP